MRNTNRKIRVDMCNSLKGEIKRLKERIKILDKKIKKKADANSRLNDIINEKDNEIRKKEEGGKSIDGLEKMSLLQ